VRMDKVATHNNQVPFSLEAIDAMGSPGSPLTIYGRYKKPHKVLGARQLWSCVWQEMSILYINSRSASVRDATVPRFNPPAEPARTVRFGKRDSARTVGFGNQAASAREIPEEPGSERTRERFDCERV